MSVYVFTVNAKSSIESVMYGNWHEDDFERHVCFSIKGVVESSDKGFLDSFTSSLDLSHNRDKQIEDEFAFGGCRVYDSHVHFDVFLSRFDIHRLVEAVKDSVKGFSKVSIECAFEFDGELDKENICNIEYRRIVSLQTDVDYKTES